MEKFIQIKTQRDSTWFHVTLELEPEYNLSVNWEARKVIGYDDKKPIFEDSNGVNVEEAAKSVVFLKGSTKWDGCSNFEFPEQEECMHHTCSRHSMEVFGLLLGRLYDESAFIMKRESRNEQGKIPFIDIDDDQSLPEKEDEPGARNK